MSVEISDIDGNKNTNIYGVDVFKFVLTNTKNSYLYPFGGKYHTHYWRGIDAEVSPSCQPENNFFNGETQGKWGKHLYRGAIALETQNFPDAIHQESFSIKPVLNPGEKYTQTCIYKFSVKK